MIEAFNPGTLLATFGLLGLLAVVFIETGLLVGFLLPGDSLLFTAGIFAAQLDPAIPIWLLLLTVPLAAVAGDQCGFVIGAKAGPAVFDRPSAKRLEHHRERARAFFDNYGAATVVLARFIPVLRTLAPVVAGASQMRHRTFLGYNVIGALAWGAGVPLLGYLLGGIGFVRDHLDLMLIGVVAASLLPVVAGYARDRIRRALPEPAASPLAPTEPTLAGHR